MTSGVVVGGADIDARNGIITNHNAAAYNGLTVSKVHVSDGVADLIKGNKGKECKADGYRIFVFVPYLSATVEANKLTYADTGLFVTQASVGQATVSASNNTIHGNGTGANGDTGTIVEAQNNWWHCEQGPNLGKYCDTAIGTVNYTPGLTAKP